MNGSIKLTVVEIRPEAADIATFVFRPAGTPIAHSAGQSMTLRLPVEGGELHRTFSIASAPGGDTIAMTIKAHRDGRATTWMHRVLKPGDEVSARGPNGRFTVDLEPSGPVAFVSAGSGASPLMSMLRHLAATQAERDMVWLHWARTPGDVLFATEIADLQRRCPNLRVAMFATLPAPGWFGFSGRPRRATVAAAAPDIARRAVFCCGPEGFMAAVRAIHAAEGGDGAKFHIEHFGSVRETKNSGAAVQLGGAGDATAFEIRLGDKSFQARADETLLSAATRQNVVIPCGCASGICGTCRVRLVSGDVEMHHNGGLSPEDEAGGSILACSSRPRSHVSIEL